MDDISKENEPILEVVVNPPQNSDVPSVLPPVETVEIPPQEPKPARSLGWLKMLFGFFLFVLVILGGYYGWQKLAAKRILLSQEYFAKAAELVKTGDAQALWELEKAYWLGADYRDYRLQRALVLSRLGDVTAESELKSVIDQGWANDEVNYRYGILLFDRGEKPAGAGYLNQVSPEVDYDWKKNILTRLGVRAGDQGDWEGVKNYLEQAGKISGELDLFERAQLGSSLIGNDLTIVVTADIPAQKLAALEELRGDAYALAVADILIDLDLEDWARRLLSGLSIETLAQLDVVLLQAKVNLKVGDCQQAWHYLEQARVIDSTEKRISTLEEEIYKCLNIS